MWCDVDPHARFFQGKQQNAPPYYSGVLTVRTAVTERGGKKRDGKWVEGREKIEEEKRERKRSCMKRVVGNL